MHGAMIKMHYLIYDTLYTFQTSNSEVICVTFTEYNLHVRA